MSSFSVFFILFFWRAFQIFMKQENLELSYPIIPFPLLEFLTHVFFLYFLVFLKKKERKPGENSLIRLILTLCNS